METKQCNKCNEKVELSLFRKDNKNNDGLSGQCKKCLSILELEARRTKSAVIRRIYNAQVERSKIKMLDKPSYSRQELENWLLDDWIFNLLFDNWKNTGFKKDMKPSTDRLNDYIGYTFENIRIVTWEENNSKGNYDQRNGNNNKSNHGVVQYFIDGKFIKAHCSIISASRLTKVDRGGITNTCKKKTKSSGGFIWKYSKEINV